MPPTLKVKVSFDSLFSPGRFTHTGILNTRPRKINFLYLNLHKYKYYRNYTTIIILKLV